MDRWIGAEVPSDTQMMRARRALTRLGAAMPRVPRPPPTLPELPLRFAADLLAWYGKHKRDLPWRHTPDPYRIWVSEIMLQQTTVAAVIPYYHRFLERFPTVGALAEAPLEDVLSRWSGLGYYSRARNLKKAAEQVHATHADRVPATYDAIRALPGIGDYTAGAILSIAYGVAEPVLDGNVARVLTRLFAIPGDPKSTPLKAHLRAVAKALVDAKAPGDFNQAMMELGATVCTPRKPTCSTCPVAAHCAARRLDRVAEFPHVAPRASPEPQRLAVALVEEDGAYLMVRRTARLMQGLYEFPGGEVPLEGPIAAPLAALLARELDLPVELGDEQARIKHSIMNRKIELVALSAQSGPEATRRARELVASGAAAWVRPEHIAEFGVSSMALKVLAELARKQTTRPGRAGR